MMDQLKRNMCIVLTAADFSKLWTNNLDWITYITVKLLIGNIKFADKKKFADQNK